MKFYSHFCLLNLLCYIYKYTSLKIKPELQKTILKFGYEINYKYEGMLAYLFNRFYVVTKFILPTMDDLELPLINYDKECKYLENLDDNEEIKTYIEDLITYCVKAGHSWFFTKYRLMHTTNAHHILKNEVNLILPKFPEGRKSNRGILAQ